MQDAGDALATLEVEKMTVMDEADGLRKRNKELTAKAKTSEGIKASLES